MDQAFAMWSELGLYVSEAELVPSQIDGLAMIVVDQVLKGRVAPLGTRGASSGIDKKAVHGRLLVRHEGLIGDEQGDQKHHGGPDKALHHYAFDHYQYWRNTIGEREMLRQPGAFGENLSTRGITESEVAVGDTFRLGEALIQVSQGRQPCWKLNARFNVVDMALRVQRSGLTGWYYRVIEEGSIERGDVLQLVDRLSPDWTIRRLWRALYVDVLNLEELSGICRLDHLAGNWRGYAQRRLASRRVEDWSRRLEGA